MLKIFKLIQKLFFNYRDHIRIKINKKDPKLHTLVKALSKEKPHLQLLSLIENDPNCDALAYALKDKVHPFKIWYKGDMLIEKDIIFNLVNDFLISDLPYLEQDSEGNTILHSLAKSAPGLLLNLFKRFSNDDLVSFFNTQLSTSKIDKDGNSEISTNTILHSLAKSAPGLLLNLFKRFSNEQLIDYLFTEDDDGKTAIETVIKNCSDSSLKQLFESFSNLESFLSMQLKMPEFAKNDGVSCNEDSILHIIALHKPHLLPDLLKKFPSEQLTNLLKMQDNKKDTVLHVIAKSNTRLFLDLLVKDLVDEQDISLLSIKNDEGRTPLYYAVSYHESRDAIFKKYGMENCNNPLDFVLKVIEKVDLKSRTNLKPFIDLLNIKCDGDVTLPHMILQEPYEDKWKEVVEQIPNYILKQGLDTYNGSENILLDKLKIAVLNQRLGKEEVLKILIPKIEKCESQLNSLNIESIDHRPLESKSQRSL